MHTADRAAHRARSPGPSSAVAASPRASQAAVQAVVDKLSATQQFADPMDVLAYPSDTRRVPSHTHERLHAATLEAHRMFAPEAEACPRLGHVTQLLARLRRENGPSFARKPSDEAEPPLRTVVSNRRLHDRTSTWKVRRDARLENARQEHAAEVARREAVEAAEIAANRGTRRASPATFGRFIDRVNAWSAAKHSRDTYHTRTSDASPALPSAAVDNRKHFNRPVTAPELLLYIDRMEARL
jgi:hypothetical protein